MSTNGASNPPSETAAADQNTDLSKDQVGWYFVEQYYNTVSKTPEKLHLFYGKRSQFVYGVEAEVAKISVGRQSIQERIKQLDFQDCKVRISNVDTQSSFENIVIQVIGEFSNKGGEPKKFVQTFILAQQPSGYFVLNDILRSIDDEDSEEDSAEAQEPEPASETILEVTETSPEEEPAKAEEPAAETPATETLDAVAVDKKLEEVGETPLTETPTTESVTEAAEPAIEVAPAPAEKPATAAESPDPEATVREIAEEDAKEPEKPKDPSPTPVAPKVTAPEPEKPAAAPSAAPFKPMTWASRLAASTGGAPRPVVPLKAATPPAPAQTRAPPPPQPAQPAQQAAAGQPAEASAPSRKADANEWQTAENVKRQNRPQSMVGASGEKESTSCYVKYISEKIQHDDLKAALGAHGDLIYFDINRPKNCAFVEYATVAAYQAAIASSPYIVNGESITVEPRRKSGGYGGSGYGPGRGGMTGRGRGGFEGGRSGSQGGRGGFGSAGGRGRGASRGSRGAAQVGSS